MARVFVYGLLFLVVLFFFSLGGGRSAFFLQVPFHLACGWVYHGWNALPPFLAGWQEALLPLGCLALAVALANRFIIRWAEKKRPSLIWRMRHTVAVFSLILLCSAAAVATSGVVHQLVWLGKGKITHDSSRKIERTVAVSNGRLLMLALLGFYEEEGRYPVAFEELRGLGLTDRLWMIDTGDSGVREPFVLLRPGSTDIALDTDPLIVSPLLGDGRKLVVGFGDTSVLTVNEKAFSYPGKTRKPAADE